MLTLSSSTNMSQGRPYSKDTIFNVRKDLECNSPGDVRRLSYNDVLKKLRKCENLQLDGNKDLRRRFREDIQFQARYGSHPQILTGKAHCVNGALVDLTLEELQDRLIDYLCFDIIAPAADFTGSDDENDTSSLTRSFVLSKCTKTIPLKLHGSLL